MSLLSGIDKLVSQIAGPLLFEQAKLLRGGSYSINPSTGQTVFTPSTEYVKAIEGDYSAFHRQSLDIPDINRKLSIIGYQVTTPRPGDRVSIRGVIWEIVRVERDPANALYECEVKPIGADLAGDPGATTNALTPLPGLLASIAGPLLFSPATLFRAQNTSIDSNGQAVRTDGSENIMGLEVEYTATHRAQAGIPETDRSLLVLGAGLSGAPTPGDRIDINGTRFEIVRTKRDPARAVYECQSRPIGAAVSIRYATHAGLLPVVAGTATAQLTFFYHAGVLPAFQTVANAAALISAISGMFLPAFEGQADAEAGALAYTGGVLPPYTGNSAARVDIAAAHVGALPSLAGVTGASVRVSGSHAGSLAPIAGVAIVSAANGRIASHAGTLPAMGGARSATVATAASSARSLPAFGGTATGSAAVAASSLRSLPAYQGSAQAQNAATGQTGSIMAAFAGTATAQAATAASHAGALPAVGGLRTATGAVSALHAGTLPPVTGTASATLATPASEAAHTGALPALSGAVTATGAIVATQARSLPAFAGTAAASNANATTQARNLPAFQGTAVASAAIAATQARSIPAFAGTATSANGVSATQAQSLPAYQGTATASNAGSGGEEAETTALVARMTVEPNALRRAKINTLIASLKAAGVWNKLDVLYLFASHTEQAALLNWKSSSFTATKTGPDLAGHFVDDGFGNAANASVTASHIETGYNPQAGGVNYVGTSSHFGFFSKKIQSFRYMMAMYPTFFAGLIRVEGTVFGRSGFNSQPTIKASPVVQRGHYMMNRNATNDYGVYNGTFGASSTPDTNVQGPLRFLIDGSTADGTRMAVGHAGAFLTEVEATALYNSLDAYLVAILESEEPSVKADSTLIKSDSTTVTADSI